MILTRCLSTGAPEKSTLMPDARYLHTYIHITMYFSSILCKICNVYKSKVNKSTAKFKKKTCFN